jgi:hypothetical protein
MTKKERMRDPLRSIPTAEYWRDKMRDGWQPVAIEWERERSGEQDAECAKVPPPYGLRVAEDCTSLEPDYLEMEVLTVMLEAIVSDRSLTEVAEELNRHGFSTRSGTRWTQVLVFHMLPRLIEVAPEINSTAEWSDRIRQLGLWTAAKTGT